MKKLIGIILSIWSMCYSTEIIAQSVEQIKAEGEMYVWGEGRGNAIRKADREALSGLIDQITSKMESDFTCLQQGKSASEYRETVKSVIRTYSNFILTNTECIVSGNEPDVCVFRYIKWSEIGQIFKVRKNKILEYLARAERAEERLQIADAMRYYYWSHTLLRSHPEGETICYRDKDGEEHLAVTWIPLKIDTLFSRVSVTISRVVPEGNFQTVELAILYDHQPVRNFDYTYWDGRNWSDMVSAKDGRGIAKLPALADVTHLRIKGEYVFEDEAMVDAELKNVLDRLEGVLFQSCYIEAYPAKQTPAPLGKSVVSAEKMLFRSQREMLDSFFRSAPDSKPYLSVMKKVEKAIRERNYEGLQNCFTPEGYSMFNKLIREGQVRIVGTPDYRLVQCDDGIFCRSLPLSFHFGNNNRTFVEDVVFDFSKDAKIQGLSFGLSQSALADIVSKADWSERSRRILIRFLENYQTAYALKRLEYIESIFAEDALMVVDAALKKQGIAGREGTIKRSSLNRQHKKQYIKSLRTVFADNKFINFRFSDSMIQKKSAEEIYGVQIWQDYFSSDYGDSGYLFLIVDLNNPDQPVIVVQVWQPEKDPDVGWIDLNSFY